MNKDTVIKVNTPLGDTEERSTGPGLGQGTVEGAVLSSNNLDGGVQEKFVDSNDIHYGNIQLKPLLFQDDVASPSSDLENAQENNERMKDVVESKLLDFNLEKSVFLVIGNNKFKKEVQKKLEDKPLLLCGRKVNKVESYSYLGKIISNKGLSQCVTETINKRYVKAYKAIYEINIIIQDVRVSVLGAFSTAMMLWEMSVLPALLNSASCWFKLPKAALNKLNKLSQLFLSTVLQAWPKCPAPALYWFTGSILPINKIIEEKVLLLRHMTNLDSTCLAAEVLMVNGEWYIAITDTL